MASQGQEKRKIHQKSHDKRNLFEANLFDGAAIPVGVREKEREMKLFGE